MWVFVGICGLSRTADGVQLDQRSLECFVDDRPDYDYISLTADELAAWHAEKLQQLASAGFPTREEAQARYDALMKSLPNWYYCDVCSKQYHISQPPYKCSSACGKAWKESQRAALEKLSSIGDELRLLNPLLKERPPLKQCAVGLPSDPNPHRRTRDHPIPKYTFVTALGTKRLRAQRDQYRQQQEELERWMERLTEMALRVKRYREAVPLAEQLSMLKKQQESAGLDVRIEWEIRALRQEIHQLVSVGWKRGMPEEGKCRISTGCHACKRKFWETKDQLDGDRLELAMDNLKLVRFGYPIHDVLHQDELYLELL